MLRWALARPWLLTSALTGLGLAWVRPWGDFPLNDDFIYARFARAFAEHGTLRLDVPTVASAIGQSVLVAPFLRCLGFSHTLLRVLSMLVGVLGLWGIDRLLAMARVGAGARFAVVLTLGLSPIYLYLQTTFMTDLWGHVAALLGVLGWFGARARAEARGSASVVSPLAAIGVGALIGASFWSRQFCAVAFPAVAGASLLRLLVYDTARLRASLGALLAGSAVFALLIRAYFPWAQSTGNLRPEFSQPLAALWRIEPVAWLIGAANLLVYATAFFAPVLALLAWPRRSRKGLTAVAVGLVGLALVGWALLQTHAETESAPAASLHRVFPFAGNVLYNAGLGPITLTDVYQLDLGGPRWPTSVWIGIQLVLFALAALWAPVLLALRRLVSRERPALAVELSAFAVLFGAASLLVPLQAYKFAVFDRYYLPCLFALAIVLAQALGEGPPPRRWRAAPFAALLLPLVLFSFAGLHDQFRWNEARWALVARAQALGVRPTNLDGGYEVNGWLAVDAVQSGATASDCVGRCGCGRGWWCLDASWAIGMNVLSGYQVVASIAPGYRLASGPPLMLSRRLPNVDLVRYRTASGLRVTTAPATPDAVEQARWRILSGPDGRAAALYECRGRERPFLSIDPACEGAPDRALLGYLHASFRPGSLPLYRCRVAGGKDRFVSQDPRCEGQLPETLLGFAFF
jgi:hypothetical protein